MTRQPHTTFPWKTIRENVPYEGRTRQKDRARRTLTVLLKLRMAVQETRSEKSMQVNDNEKYFFL